MVVDTQFSPGFRLADRYRIEGAVGRGGMGSVYAAFDELVGERLALKLLTRSDEDALSIVRREVRLARKVTHRNIGRTYDLGRDGAVLFITMELVAGESLLDLLNRRGPLGASQAAALMRQAADGMEAAHASGVVHRDLKPSNMLLESSGRVVIIDFGVAAVGTAEGPLQSITGTLDYMAPEQLAGAPPSAEQDVFALGVIVFMLATGRRPFDGPNLTTRAMARLDEPPDLSALAHDPLAAVVARCLARDARERPTAGELAAQLSGCAGGAVYRSLPPAPLSVEEIPTVAASRPKQQTVGVLAFDWSGSPSPGGHDLAAAAAPVDLGRALADELADTLSKTRGLRVISPAGMRWATAELGEATRENVDLVVHGAIRADGDVFRVTSRLSHAITGEQRFSAELEAPATRLLELPGRLALRVCEALRLELEPMEWPPITELATLAFIEARSLLRSPNVPASAAVAAFERCLLDAPGFPPALAGRALALARSYILPDDDTVTPHERVATSVREAVELVPLAPDARFAEAMLSVADSAYGDAIRQIYATLDLAPTHAFAQEVLGRIECESGHADRGAARLRLALELDARLYNSLALVARGHALRGRIEACDEAIERMESLAPSFMLEGAMLCARVALWTSDRKRAERALREIPADARPRVRPFRFAQLVAELVRDGRALAPLRSFSAELLGSELSQRSRVTIHQICTDYEAAKGEPTRALDHLEAALACGLIDLEWLERCPALDSLRDEARFGELARALRERVAQLWLATPARPVPAGFAVRGFG